MLEYLWRSIHSPDYLPNVLEWMLHILLSPFMVIMCLMVGALAGKWWRALPYGSLICYVVFLSRSSFYRWESIFPLAGLPALAIDGAPWFLFERSTQNPRRRKTRRPLAAQALSRP